MTRPNIPAFEILGWSNDTGAIKIQVTDDIHRAVDWVKDNTPGDLGGWEKILIQLNDGTPIQSLDLQGWSYYHWMAA